MSKDYHYDFEAIRRKLENGQPISEAELAAYTGRSGLSWYRDRRAGRISFIRCGGRVAYLKRFLDEYYARNTIDAQS